MAPFVVVAAWQAHFGLEAVFLFIALSLLQKSDSELRILFKSRLHGIHWATLCVLLSWPPDKRTLVLGQCFFQSSFFIFLPHCPAPDKRTYRAHGPAESASSAPASCAYITNPRPVTSALWFLRSCIFQLLIKKHSEKCADHVLSPFSFGCRALVSSKPQPV